MASMKVQNILFIIVLLCLHKAQCGEHPDGISQVSRAQDALGNYHFSYSVANSEGDQFRKEGTDPEGRVIGSYGLTHADGTRRVVDYVADQHGFRAEVRSNEPGVAPAADVHVDHHPPPGLAVAATSDNFGKRLLQSDVTYKEEDTLDDTVREQRNFDDYRPLNPVAYYPEDGRVVAPVIPRTLQRPLDIPRSPRLLRPENNNNPKPPADVYYPPLDPHSAIRRPAEYVPRSVDSDRNYYQTTTSRKPYIPPYGGFDDDPVPEFKPPGVSMTTIHGGLGGSRRHIPPTAPTPSYRFPPPSDPDTRDFGFPRFPPVSSRFPSPPAADRPPQFVPGLPQTPLFSPPSYPTRGGGPTNFVLRAVPIQNGIQAVRVDPSTGRIYERLVYPLYLRHDGHPAYDRNILLHNDDVSDDDEARDDPPGYLDIPYQRYRGPRERPVFDEDEGEDNRTSADISSLNRPTATDLDWVHRQLALVEGFDTDRLTNGLSSYQEGEPPSQFSSRLRMRDIPGLFDYRREQPFTRNPRFGDGNESRQRLLDESASDAKPVTESASQIEKEGKEAEKSLAVSH